MAHPKIDKKKLREFFEGCKYIDFHNGKVKRARPTEFEDGEYFVSDLRGNDLSLGIAYCREENGKKIVERPSVLEVIIPDCNEQYGSPINGPFAIPEVAIIKEEKKETV